MCEVSDTIALLGISDHSIQVAAATNKLKDPPAKLSATRAQLEVSESQRP